MVRRRSRQDAVRAAPTEPAPDRAAAPQAPYVVPFREVLVSFDDDEPRTAVLEHGQLVEVDIDRPGGRRIVGNIYKGRVQNVLRGMQAAFVDIGLDRNAFLFVDDARLQPRVAGEDAPAEPLPPAGGDIAELLRPGQEVLVQVRKEPVGGKGARVSRALSLPGRFLVLMPGLDYVGVSRRIADPVERQRLRALAQSVREPGYGLIVRTAAVGADPDAIAEDWRVLRARWEEVGARARRAEAPALVYRDLDVVERVLRDRLGPEVERVVVDRTDEWQRLRALVAAEAPAFADRIVLAAPAELREGLFTARGVDQEIERALGRRVPLPSGGYLVIDQTEALTAVDVNTGRFVGEADPDETFLRTNLEAATEIARQLRLRDIGGIIIIDFIDMHLPEHQRRVLEALTAACATDRKRPQVLGLTQLGLVEMTRRKSRQSLRDLLTRACPACEGRGRVLSEETVSRRVRRQIRTVLRESAADAVLVEVHPSVAALVIGAGGQSLRQLEQQTGRSVFVRGADDCRLEDLRVVATGARHEVEARARPVREGQVLEVRVEEPHASSREDGIARLQGYVVDIEGAGHRVGQRVKVEITRAHRTYARARIIS